MIKRLTAAALAALAAATLAVAPSSVGASPRVQNDCFRSSSRSSQNVDVVATTRDQKLICFRSNHPERAHTVGKLGPFTTDTRLVGIDVRPATGVLYGLGDKGGIYTVDPTTAVTKLVARTSVALRGMEFGVDFNPVADRLRVVSDAGQNLRINVADGTSPTPPDTDVAYTPGTPATGVVGSMYTNNDTDPDTNTTLFDVDSMLDQIAIQSPPNAGNLVATGKLGLDTRAEVGADIYSQLLRGGSTAANWAFVSVSDAFGSRFAQVDLLTGFAQVVDSFSQRFDVTGIAVLPPQPASTS
jgi:hypothetical protein